MKTAAQLIAVEVGVPTSDGEWRQKKYLALGLIVVCLTDKNAEECHEHELTDSAPDEQRTSSEARKDPKSHRHPDRRARIEAGCENRNRILAEFEEGEDGGRCGINAGQGTRGQRGNSREGRSALKVESDAQ